MLKLLGASTGVRSSRGAARLGYRQVASLLILTAIRRLSSLVGNFNLRPGSLS
jgi:hypothetical protein